MLNNFSEWWSVMSTMEHVYWLIAVPSTIIFAILILMTFIGGDLDSDAEFEVDAESDIEAEEGIPFQFITIKNLVGFFTIFSWTGLAFIKSGYSVPTVILSSTIAGIIMMLIMATIFYLMSKLTESGNINIKKAIGSVGEVYLIIQPNRKGMGKVQLKVEGSFQTLDAMTDDDNEIQTGALVDIIDVTSNNILIVKNSSK